MQAYLEDLSGFDVFMTTSSPPVPFVSDGHTLYKVPLPWTPSSDVDPSSVDVEHHTGSDLRLGDEPHSASPCSHCSHVNHQFTLPLKHKVFDVEDWHDVRGRLAGIIQRI